MDIAGNIRTITNELPGGVRLVAVSKTKPNKMILDAYNAGQRVFGENKVQDLAAKQPELPQDIQWHFIGHLQTNKVKMLAPFVSLIEAVDSLKLLKEINKEAKKAKRTISCLLQFHIAGEDTKFGLDVDEAKAILESTEFGEMENIKIAGVMGMATYTEDLAQVRREFRTLRNIFRELKITYFAEEPTFKEISMGMSGDYKIAIEEGSTLVRIGSLIFGERNYIK
jgi:hypothetical protein